MNKLLFKLFVLMFLFGYITSEATSDLFEKHDKRGNYVFGFNVKEDDGSGNFRKESRDSNGKVIGSYGLKDADGRLRIVKYVADKKGFRVNIASNEPGMSYKDSANVHVYRQRSK